MKQMQELGRSKGDGSEKDWHRGRSRALLEMGAGWSRLDFIEHHEKNMRRKLLKLPLASVPQSEHSGEYDIAHCTAISFNTALQKCPICYLMPLFL